MQRLTKKRRRERRLSEGGGDVSLPPTCPGTMPYPGASEIVSYNVKQVRALDPAVVNISRNAADKILYCILDSGLDAQHPDFDFSRVAGTTTRDGMEHDWNRTWDSHGELV